MNCHKEEYDAFLAETIDEWIKWQEEVGFDVLVHGEFERNDMVEYFGQNLSGYLFSKNGWVQSYGMRGVKPPIIWGDVTRLNPITVKWSSYAQSRTDKPVKGMLTGPVTILNWSFPREDISIKDSTLQIALAIKDEVLDLEAAGVKIIQIDEAALREKLPLRRSDWYEDYLDWAIPAFRLVHSTVAPDTQIHTHMCYSEFTDIIPAIDNLDADVISFEASRSNPWKSWTNSKRKTSKQKWDLGFTISTHLVCQTKAKSTTPSKPSLLKYQARKFGLTLTVV